MAQQAAELTLVITNPTETGGGANIEHSFGPRGGSIGSAASDSWRLSPHRTGAVAGHAEVRYLDGGFCLIDRSGRTYINSSSQPVGRGRRARLSHGDTVTIGRFRIRAELSGVTTGNVEMEDDVRLHHDLVDAPESGLRHVANEQDQPEGREPLEGLQPAAGGRFSSDPLAHWQPKPARLDEETSKLLASDRAWFAPSAEVTGEYRENRDVAMGLPVTPQRDNRERQRMPESSRNPQEVSRQHISGAPILRGLDADIDFADSDEMRLFLEEAGQTLKATVEGLLALHQGENSRHQALRTRLQPIEDNPLRLANEYPDTIQTLFAAKRSPVHLSAPAAVRESLESLNHHQQATREAIREALEAILHAFSPEALLRRFHGYRRGLQDNEDEGRWAWDMYQHYYRELKSSRQQGFERLFQEVFDQAYDQHLRQLQREKRL